jgi:hypothetical protein
MKLIALRHFARVGPLKNVEIDVDHLDLDKAPAESHIHMGALLEIGDGNDLAKMRKTDNASAQLIAQLTVAGCVGDAMNKEVVDRVKADLVAETKREAEAEKRNAKAAGLHVIDALSALLNKASVAPAE